MLDQQKVQIWLNQDPQHLHTCPADCHPRLPTIFSMVSWVSPLATGTGNKQLGGGGGVQQLQFPAEFMHYGDQKRMDLADTLFPIISRTPFAEVVKRNLFLSPQSHFRNRNSATFKEMLLRNRNSAIAIFFLSPQLQVRNLRASLPQFLAAKSGRFEKKKKLKVKNLVLLSL